MEWTVYFDRLRIFRSIGIVYFEFRYLENNVYFRITFFHIIVVTNFIKHFMSQIKILIGILFYSIKNLIFDNWKIEWDKSRRLSEKNIFSTLWKSRYVCFTLFINTSGIDISYKIIKMFYMKIYYNIIKFRNGLWILNSDKRLPYK